VARSKAYREYLARWKRINDFQTEELRQTTPAEEHQRARRRKPR